MHLGFHLQPGQLHLGLSQVAFSRAEVVVFVEAALLVFHGWGAVIWLLWAALWEPRLTHQHAWQTSGGWLLRSPLL